jgi:ATP-dependent helicase/DNAse subunit B
LRIPRGRWYIQDVIAQDKYAAVWVSHSSMGDFLKCPRAYYLHNVYKNPKTGRKITLVNPALSLGAAVHATLENLKRMPVAERLSRDLLADFEDAWAAVAGKKGGFTGDAEEAEAKARGRAMVERVARNPGPIAKKTVALKESNNGMPPNFFLSEEENIILCGLIDWIEYVDEDDSIRVVDFKTGKREESGDSLQLPIYLLLLNALQKRTVSGARYWYLEKDDAPLSVVLPDAADAKGRVLAVARRVKAAREKREFACPRGEQGCFACKPYEAILAGQAEYIGVGGYGQDVYRG